MTPDQLRELADALEPMAAAPRFDGLPVAEFCAWLRQCAEQRSVAYKHTEPDGSVAYFGADEAPCEKCVPLYAAPVPQQREPHCRCRACLSLLAEPVVEFTVCPKCGNKRCPKADDHRNACTGSNEPGQVAQAEAKREPNEKQIADACLRYRHDFGLLDKYERDCIVNEAWRWADAFGIGGSDAE